MVVSRVRVRWGARGLRVGAVELLRCADVEEGLCEWGSMHGVPHHTL